MSIRSHTAIAALVLALATTSNVHAGGDVATLTVRVVDPPSLTYEATALGRATHTLRLVLTNTGTRSAQLEPLAFRFRPLREGVLFSCDEPQIGDDRWPATLEAGASFTLTREVACDTALPGRYDVEMRARPRGGPESAERTYGSFVLRIEPGANPPVHVPWDASLQVAASGTKELRPTKDPKAVRIVLAMINGTRAPLTLAPVHASFRVTRRGSTVPPCPERGVDLAFTGALMPGRSQTLATPLGCELFAEAIYDVDIAIANAAGTKVHVATHAVRVGILPPPPPRPEDVERGKVVGGM